jgi:phosphohistidine phosphatase
MKTLLLLRHAKSSWDDDSLSDHDRPLNKRGRVAAPRIGKLLRELDLVPDLIISSTANRASTTARLAAHAAGCNAELILDQSLYLAPPERYIRVASHVHEPVERLMLVGHNPGIEMLVDILTSRSEPMPTAALAVIAVPILHWSEFPIDVRCELSRVYRPKELD